MSALWVVSSVMQWLLLLLLVVIVMGILRYLGRVEEVFRPVTGNRITRYKPGDRIHDFVSLDVTGTSWTLRDILASDRRALLIFASPGCQACEILFKQLSSLVGSSGLSPGWALYLFLRASEGGVKQFIEGSAWSAANDVKVMVDEEGGILRKFGVNALPTGLAVDTTGRVIDQSINPHAGWLYEVLNVPRPDFIGDAPGQPVPMVALRGS